MSKYVEKAQDLRNDTAVHYNCAQSVVIPFCEDGGVSEDFAQRIASNFGSGMKSGSVCGAVTGGLMALGLFGVEDGASIKEYYRRVNERIGENIDCAELVRLNELQGGSKKPHCDGLVYICTEIAEDILREKGKIR